MYDNDTRYGNPYQGVADNIDLSAYYFLATPVDQLYIATAPTLK